jgi:hypothetical protein
METNIGIQIAIYATPILFTLVSFFMRHWFRGIHDDLTDIKTRLSKKDQEDVAKELKIEELQKDVQLLWSAKSNLENKITDIEKEILVLKNRFL